MVFDERQSVCDIAVIRAESDAGEPALVRCGAPVGVGNVDWKHLCSKTAPARSKGTKSHLLVGVGGASATAGGAPIATAYAPATVGGASAAARGFLTTAFPAGAFRFLVFAALLPAAFSFPFLAAFLPADFGFRVRAAFFAGLRFMDMGIPPLDEQCMASIL